LIIFGFIEDVFAGDLVHLRAIHASSDFRDPGSELTAKENRKV
jgi:hypothetical protein